MPKHGIGAYRVPSYVVRCPRTDNKSINLQCGDGAETLGLVDKLVASGMQQANPAMKASASGF
jgi:hypothetical protein